MGAMRWVLVGGGMGGMNGPWTRSARGERKDLGKDQEQVPHAMTMVVEVAEDTNPEDPLLSVLDTAHQVRQRVSGTGGDEGGSWWLVRGRVEKPEHWRVCQRLGRVGQSSAKSTGPGRG